MTYKEFVAASARVYWKRLLTKHRGNVARAAAEAKVDRTNCYKHLKRCGLASEGRKVKAYRDIKLDRAFTSWLNRGVRNERSSATAVRVGDGQRSHPAALEGWIAGVRKGRNRP